MSHIPNKRPETCAKSLVSASKVEELKQRGFVFQFVHTIEKYQHLGGYAAIEQAQPETDAMVVDLVGAAGAAKLQKNGLRCVSFEQFQALKDEEYELRMASRRN